MTKTRLLTCLCRQPVTGSAKTLCALICVLVLSACSGGPPPRLFLLESPVLGAIDDKLDTTSIQTLGISQVKVPGYASDARIASRFNADGVVVQLDGERWAEEPEDAITRLLANRLRERAKALVLIEPWPRDYEPKARIEVSFDKLLRELDGGALLTGQIQLLSGDGRRLLQSVPFDLLIQGRSTDSTEFFRAVATGTDEIARRAIESLLGVRGNS